MSVISAEQGMQADEQRQKDRRNTLIESIHNRPDCPPMSSRLLRQLVQATTLFSTLLMAPAIAGSVTTGGVSREMALSEARRQVPRGQAVTNERCQSIEIGFDTRYRCTVTWGSEDE